MYLYHLARIVLITGAIGALIDPRQVIVTVTAGVPLVPTDAPSAPSPVPISAPPVPWQQGLTATVSASISAAVPVPTSLSTSLANLSLPPLVASSSSSTATAVSAPAASVPASGPKCGKGFTYCGDMLTNSGHNFAQSEIDKAYCRDLPGLCTGDKRKTKPGQAVFVCMEDQPSTIQLVCACSGVCLNNATSNYIAHCDKPCVNT